jgi:hypothetical protein
MKVVATLRDGTRYAYHIHGNFAMVHYVGGEFMNGFYEITPDDPPSAPLDTMIPVGRDAFEALYGWLQSVNHVHTAQWIVYASAIWHWAVLSADAAPRKCPHGVWPRTDGFAFAGAVYVCGCCGNAYGTLNTGSRRCGACAEAIHEPTRWPCGALVKPEVQS